MDLKQPVFSSEGLGWDHVRFSKWQSVPPHLMDDEVIDTNQVVTIYGCSNGSSGGGDIQICPHGYPYRYISHGFSLFIIEIVPSFMDQIAYESGFGLPGAVEIQYKVCLQDAKLWQLGTWMLEEVKSGGVNSSMYRESLATMTVLHLLQYYSSSVRPAALPGGSTYQQIAEVIQYMRENLDTEIALTQLASVANVSSPHLIRLFKKQTGYTPHQYFIRMRVERSKVLLQSGKDSLKAIASLAGFADQGHFTRLFKRFTGITPMQYANELTVREHL
ncbi:helix-turn-helix transcriptional regulator [Paenibacillus sp. SYP-B3998]|uniref:Helix-turn-helix transcriptional regulator n=1 Tax=Paenibacillus sp. SYP-B3998 TaxID=2678564 RepID=A0A6G3ZYU1_9BACL|nr:AraC family transcriptional regulator [Paenibacillus sp. SYP-B3998]NEW07386.1 helix-turn-helix transcriptional regulator [Paenibacillus sp. SYP-B3998]